MTLVELMQMNSIQLTPDWSAYCAPLFLGIGYSVDLSLAMCAHPLGTPMHFMPKSIIFIYIITQEDNAFVWFPLAFQV